MKILLAEDNEDNYLVIKSNLRKLAVETQLIWAKDGQEAIDILGEEDNIDIFLLDIEMPKVDGLELVKWIRANQKFDGVPAVAITASVFAEMKRNYEEKGFDYILEKPFSRKELLDMFENIAKIS
jgi:CheY-like chemotaxis protein